MSSRFVVTTSSHERMGGGAKREGREGSREDRLFLSSKYLFMHLHH